MKMISILNEFPIVIRMSSLKFFLRHLFVNVSM